MRAHLRQIMRFCAVGLGCLALGLAVLAGLHDVFGVNYLIAYVASFVLSNIAGYLLNARFTFFADSIDHSGAARYLLVNTVMLGVNTAVMKLLVDGFRMWYLGAAILLAGVSTPVTFLAQRLVTFQARERGREARG